MWLPGILDDGKTTQAGVLFPSSQQPLSQRSSATLKAKKKLSILHGLASVSATTWRDYSSMKSRTTRQRCASQLQTTWPVPTTCATLSASFNAVRFQGFVKYFLRSRTNGKEKRVIFLNFRQPPNTLHIHSSDRERTWPEAHCHVCDCRAFSTMARRLRLASCFLAFNSPYRKGAALRSKRKRSSRYYMSLRAFQPLPEGLQFYEVTDHTPKMRFSAANHLTSAHHVCYAFGFG